MDYSHYYPHKNNLGEIPTILFTGLILLNSQFISPELRLPTLKLWPKKAPKVQQVRDRVDEPHPYYWVLIGECYIHGFMDGEAIAFQNAKEIRPQKFELR